MENIRDVLIELNKRINRIEARNSNFTQSRTWKKLRKMQDEAFLVLAREKLHHYEAKGKSRCQDSTKNKMEFYKKYISNAEANNDY